MRIFVTCCHKSTQINTTNTQVPLRIVRTNVNTRLIELLGQFHPKVRLTLTLINSKPLRFWRRHCTRSWVSFPARTTSCFYQLPLVNIKILVLVHTSTTSWYYSYSIFFFHVLYDPTLCGHCPSFCSDYRSRSSPLSPTAFVTCGFVESLGGTLVNVRWKKSPFLSPPSQRDLQS